MWSTHLSVEIIEVGCIEDFIRICNHLGDGIYLVFGGLPCGIIDPVIFVQTFFEGSLHSINHPRHIRLWIEEMLWLVELL